MLFSSYIFVFFFVAVFALNWILRDHLRWQNMLLLAASWVFYGWWDWRFLILLLSCIALSWGAGLLMDCTRHRKAVVAVVTVYNLAVLCVFKYLGFFRDNAVALLEAMGFNPDWPTVDVLLPVGVSFFTFQSIAYVVDVYRDKVNAERDVVTFALFISFFPQLVAGPIERSTTLLPQFRVKRQWRYDQAVEGMRVALWGLVKKIVIADACAHYVSRFFSIDASPVQCVLGALLFSVQIYCDFSGYCDIALGTAKLLGIRLMQNFKYPYFSQSVHDFWRRWNASLTLWFQDYVYIPLGGSRVSKTITARNVMIVFLLSGLWHGAGWCFILWGAYWGVCNVVFRRRDIGIPSVCALAVVGWTMFRSDSIAMLSHMLPPVILFCAGAAVVLSSMIKCVKNVKVRGCISKRAVRIIAAVAIIAVVGSFLLMGTAGLVHLIHYYLFVAIPIVFGYEWLCRDSYGLSRLPGNTYVRRLMLALLVFIVLTSHTEDMAFIYFQF